MKSKSYDHPAINRRYFFPSSSSSLSADEQGGPLSIRWEGDSKLGCYWHRPLRAAPTLLYFHGNGESIADQLDRWPTWGSCAGANIFFLDYPGYATSSGRPSITSCASAAAAALDYLLAQPEDVVPAVVVVGRSVGTIFALHTAWQAHSSRVRGLVLESGVADVSRRLDLRVPYEQLGLDRSAIMADLNRDFDHRRKIRELTVPLMVLHTRHDEVVDCWNGEQIAAWAGDNLYRFEIFERGGHNDIQWVNEAAYRSLLADFLGHVSDG